MIAGAYGALFTVFAWFVWFFIRMAGRVATGVAYDLRRKGFARLQELSFSYYDTRPVGWLMTRLTSDVSKVSGLIPWFSLDLVWGTCFISGIIIAMFYLNWLLALIVIVILPITALPLIRIGRKLRRAATAGHQRLQQSDVRTERLGLRAQGGNGRIELVDGAGVQRGCAERGAGRDRQAGGCVRQVDGRDRQRAGEPRRLITRRSFELRNGRALTSAA